MLDPVASLFFFLFIAGLQLGLLLFGVGLKGVVCLVGLVVGLVPGLFLLGGYGLEMGGIRYNRTFRGDMVAEWLKVYIFFGLFLFRM